MENNWKDRAKEILEECSGLSTDEENNRCYYAWEIYDAMEESMNLVFEATKKECADKATLCWKNESHSKGYPYFAWNPNGKKENGDLATHIDRESILNINKPNL